MLTEEPGLRVLRRHRRSDALVWTKDAGSEFPSPHITLGRLFLPQAAQRPRVLLPVEAERPQPGHYVFRQLKRCAVSRPTHEKQKLQKILRGFSALQLVRYGGVCVSGGELFAAVRNCATLN